MTLRVWHLALLLCIGGLACDGSGNANNPPAPVLTSPARPLFHDYVAVHPDKGGPALWRMQRLPKHDRAEACVLADSVLNIIVMIEHRTIDCFCTPSSTPQSATWSYNGRHLTIDGTPNRLYLCLISGELSCDIPAGAAVIMYDSLNTEALFVDQFASLLQEETTSEVREALYRLQVELPRDNVLHEALREHEIDQARRWIGDAVLVGQRGFQGRTPLHIAISYRHDNLAASMLETGFDPEMVDNSGRTVLHEAVMHGAAELVPVLLARGASPSARDVVGDTPLHMAADRGYLRIAEQLIKAGAKCDQRNDDGKLPIDLARAGTRPDADLLKLLESK